MEQSFINLLKEETDKATCCADNIIEIKGWLTTQLEDEIKAFHQYQEASDKLSELGEGGLRLSKVLNEMSFEEYGHFLNLGAAISILNEICACGGNKKVKEVKNAEDRS